MAEMVYQQRSKKSTRMGVSQQRSGGGRVLEDNRAAFKEAAQLKENKTGLPDNLKSGIESLSGMSMDHVKVHYNSSQPAQLNALAYAQGSDIHVAPGQEKHVPHEAWHVVQQAQGRVKPTMQMKDGIPVNDDKGLEREADVMGEKAVQMRVGMHDTRPAPVSLDDFPKAQSKVGLQMEKIDSVRPESSNRISSIQSKTIQRYIEIKDPRNPIPVENNEEPIGKLRYPDGKFINFDKQLWNTGMAYRATIYENIFGHTEEQIPLQNIERFEWFQEYAQVLFGEISDLVEAFYIDNSKIQENVAAIRSGKLIESDKERLIEENKKLGPDITKKKNEIMGHIFKNVDRREDLAALTKIFLEGKIIGLPYVSGPLALETDSIVKQLITLNEKGIITYESQPSEEIEGSEDVKYSQQAFISFSLPADMLSQLAKKVKEYNAENEIQLVLSSTQEAEFQPLKVAFSKKDVEIPRSEKQETEDGFFYKIYVMANSPSRYLDLVKRTNKKSEKIFRDEITATIFFDSFVAEDTNKLIGILIELYERCKVDDL
jgi:hypothetical protein